MIDLIAKYIKEKEHLDKLKENCDSSWGYYLHNEIETVDNLKKQIQDKLIALIDERIKKALSRIGD